MPQSVDTLERWKSIAGIASAIAIPFVLAVVGYFIQKQLASDGLKKDYVSIAASILKESAEGQEPDLRKWAVEVLDKNSPIPFTPNAKRSLEQGLPVIVSGLPLIPPYEDCMQPPEERTVGPTLHEIEKKIAQNRESKDQLNFVLDQLLGFIELVVQQEHEAAKTNARLSCMQSWAKLTIDADDAWRKKIGAPDSKSEYERALKEAKQKAEQLDTSH